MFLVIICAPFVAKTMILYWPTHLHASCDIKQASILILWTQCTLPVFRDWATRTPATLWCCPQATPRSTHNPSLQDLVSLNGFSEICCFSWTAVFFLDHTQPITGENRSVFASVVAGWGHISYWPNTSENMMKCQWSNCIVGNVGAWPSFPKEEESVE